MEIEAVFEPARIRLRPLLLAGILVFAGVYRLDSAPPLWWDEGWTLSVARNWVEAGHYGLLNAGVPSAHGLAGHFPIVASAALSFLLLGVGSLQARLPFVLFTLGSFWALYLLGRSLFNPKTAAAAVLLTVLLPISDELNPLIAGRQVLGEMVMLAFFLSGCYFLWKGLNGSWINHLAAVLFWSMALLSKAQLLPFFITAVSAAVLLSLWRRRLRPAAWLAAVAICAYAGYTVLTELVVQIIEMNNAGVPMGMPANLLDVTAFVPDLAVRTTNFTNALAFAWWVALGLVSAVLLTIKRVRRGEYSPEGDTVRTLVLTLVLAWFGWYVAFGMLWLRYLFPVLFIGSLFAAEWLSGLTHGFDLAATRKALADTSRLTPASRLSVARMARLTTAAGLAGLGIVCALLTIAVYTIRIFLPASDPAAAAAYLDANLPAGALVESYDPEILFLSDVSIHFPPDSVSVTLIRRAFIDPSTDIDYDPLAADPDYLLVGPFSGRYALYAGVVAAGEFDLEARFPGYTLYRRAAP